MLLLGGVGSPSASSTMPRPRPGLVLDGVAVQVGEATMATSISAEPNMVNRKNFSAA